MATLATFDIDSVAGYTAYTDQATAETRLGGRFGSAATTWLALSDDNKRRTLVTASDILDRLSWLGSQTVASQPRAFPRTGIEDREGEAVTSTDIPPDIITATIEIAVFVSENAAFAENPTGGNLNKRLKAGSAEIEFFRPSSDSAGPLPDQLLKIVGTYLAGQSGSTTVLGAITNGTDNTSDLTADFGLNRN